MLNLTPPIAASAHPAEASASRTRVLISDDHQLVTDALSAFLSAKGYTVITASSFDETLARLSEDTAPDVTLLDLQMPGMMGIPSLEKVVKAAAGGHVVLFSSSVEPSFLRAALSLNVRGFVPKTLPLRSLASVIELINSGQVFVPAQDDQSLLDDDLGKHGLTKTELSVLRLAAQGETNKQIAFSLQVGEPRVKMHMRNICEKINAKNRAHASVIARENGWL